MESLRVRAQRAPGAGKGRLVDSSGSVLDGGVPLKEIRLQTNAEPLTQIRRVDMAAAGPWLRSLVVVAPS